ncbi:MAG: type II toxin-antitoxin system PemK/MazF family toxin, partial [Brevibacterium aurantiacum]
EEDNRQGKDRPSLVVVKDGRWVLALMLTSTDLITGGVGEVREDRHAKWMNIGSGEWDSQGRPSEIRLDRVIRLDPETIRREGSIMPREIFEQVANNVNAG